MHNHMTKMLNCTEKLTNRTLLKDTTIAGVGILSPRRNLLKALPAVAITRETWDIVGNGFQGQLIFTAIASHSNGYNIPGSVYYGTAYGNPILSHFVSKGNGKFDMAFLRADTTDFSYFQLWYGEWDSIQRTMSGQFYGIIDAPGTPRVDGPYSWHANLKNGGVYDTFSDISPSAPLMRIAHAKRDNSDSIYHDLSLFNYTGGTASKYLEGYIRDFDYLLLGYSSIQNYAFITPTHPTFTSFQLYFGKPLNSNGFKLDGTNLVLVFKRTTNEMISFGTAPWHSIRK